MALVAVLLRIAIAPVAVTAVAAVVAVAVVVVLGVLVLELVGDDGAGCAADDGANLAAQDLLADEAAGGASTYGGKQTAFTALAELGIRTGRAVVAAVIVRVV